LQVYPRLEYENNAATTLVEGLGSTDTSCVVDDVSEFPEPPFTISINAEIILVTEIDETNNILNGMERGQEDTTPASHDTDDVVEHRPTAGWFYSVTRFVDEGEDEEFEDAIYKLVVEDGELYLEVVES